MKSIEIIAAFELEINKIDNLLEKPVTDDSLYWLNQAIIKFVKIRFNRDFVHGTSYEQTAKRTEDLISLYKVFKHSFNGMTTNLDILVPINPHSLDGDFEELNPGEFIPVSKNLQYDTFTINYPKDYMYPLSESVLICNKDNKNLYNTSVFECTNDNFMYRITNSLTDFHYKNKKARPLLVRTNTGCTLYTDKQYKINFYTLSYLRKPNKLTITDRDSKYEEFPDHILQEIIKIAAQMYIENLSDQRYKTISNEVNTQE